MGRALVTIVAIVVFFVGTGNAHAATIAELQAQIQSLLLQITALKAQMLQGNVTTPNVAFSCPNLTRTLSRGSRGTDVTQLQQFLISQNLLASDSATGFFGAMTEAAVKQWQSKNGIASSGTPAMTGYGAVGPRTRAALVRCTASVNTASPTYTYTAPSDTRPTPNVPIAPTNPTTTVSCTSLAPQTQTISCPAGQTGSVTQTRTSFCATGATTPTWNAWQTTANSCASPQPTPTQPLIGAIRWDAWFPGNTTALPGYVPSSIYTTWSYREPSNGWYDAGSATAQSIMDQEINDAADHGLDFWAFNNYWAITNFPAMQSQWLLYDAFKKYMASPHKHRLKFTFIVNAGSLAYGDASQVTLGFWDTYRPYLVEMFKDPQYLKVEGNRPVLFVQNDVQNFLAQWSGGNYPGWTSVRNALNNELHAAGLGDVFIANTVMDLSGASASIEGATSYGVMNNKAKPSLANCTLDQTTSIYHCPFSAQAAKDKGNWAARAQSGVYTIPGLTPTNDPRPRNYGFYVDQPTYTQWQQLLKDTFAFMNSQSKKTNPPLALVYAWNELDEGGPGIMPTKQNGTMYLDAIKAVKSGNYPSTYNDVYNGDNLAITLTASAGNLNNWINYAPLGGNFNNDEQISQSIGESATLTVDNTTDFEVKGTKGPNRGIMQIFIDGVSQVTITLTNQNWYQNQSLFKSAALPAGTHTLRIVNVSTDANVAQVGIDQIIVTKRNP